MQHLVASTWNVVSFIFKSISAARHECVQEGARGQIRFQEVSTLEVFEKKI